MKKGFIFSGLIIFVGFFSMLFHSETEVQSHSMSSLSAEAPSTPQGEKKIENKASAPVASQAVVAGIIRTPQNTAFEKIEKPHIIRQRKIEIDHSYLKAKLENIFKHKESADRQFSLDLFPDVNVSMDIKNISQSMHKGYFASGKVDGDPESQFNLIHEKGILILYISTKHKDFEITQTAQGTVVLEVDRALRKSDDPESHAEMKALERLDRHEEWTAEGDESSSSASAYQASAGAAAAAVDTSNFTEVDILVAYTPKLLKAKGSVAAVEASAQLAVEMSNETYINSLISQKLKLVGIHQLEADESGSGVNDWNAAISTNGGRWDGIHAERSRLKADVAIILVQTMNDYCGYATINAGKSNAFGVVEESCIGGHTFVHEVGHNMGAQHDPATGGTPAYSYGVGYVDKVHGFHTIMAKGDRERRVMHFSNPNQTYNGWPTGTAKADNARVHNNRAKTVAGFFKPVVSNPTPNPVPGNPQVQCEIELVDSANITEAVVKKQYRFSVDFKVSSGTKGKVDLFLMKDGADVLKLKTTTSARDNFRIPASVPVGEGYYLQVRAVKFPGCIDQSQNQFELFAK